MAPGSVTRRLALVAAAYAVGSSAGWLFATLGIPLPWIVGPLVAIAAISGTQGAPPISPWNRWLGQMIIAGAVGLNLTPDAMSSIAAQTLPMLLVAATTILAAIGLASTLVRSHNMDRATALFASLPGGPLEMSTLAAHYGGNPGIVAFSQTVRIAFTVILIPPILIATGASMQDFGASVADVHGPGLAVVALAAIAGGFGFHWLRLSNAFFLGPLLAVALITVLELPTSPIPRPLLAIGQIAMGVALGAMFDRRTLVAAAHFVGRGLLIGALLLVLAFSLGGVLSALLDESFPMLVLAAAPGGTPEMAVTAASMSLDASLVTAFHLVRILIIVSLAPLVFRLWRHLRGRPGETTGG